MGHFVGGAEIQDPRPSLYNIRVLVVGVEWSACVETCYSRSPPAKLPSAASVTADRSGAAPDRRHREWTQEVSIGREGEVKGDR